MSDVNDLHPAGKDGRLYMHQFNDAYELHIAAGAMTWAKNKSMPTLDATQLAARRNILDIASSLIIAERNRALDEFCTSWLRHRELPIPSWEPKS